MKGVDSSYWDLQGTAAMESRLRLPEKRVRTDAILDAAAASAVFALRSTVRCYLN